MVKAYPSVLVVLRLNILSTNYRQLFSPSLLDYLPCLFALMSNNGWKTVKTITLVPVSSLPAADNGAKVHHRVYRRGTCIPTWPTPIFCNIYCATATGLLRCSTATVGKRTQPFTVQEMTRQNSELTTQSFHTEMSNTHFPMAPWNPLTVTLCRF